MTILDVAHQATSGLAEALREAAPGSNISGITVVALIADDAFVMPLVSGPDDITLAQVDTFSRRVMANALRALADRWDTRGI